MVLLRGCLALAFLSAFGLAQTVAVPLQTEGPLVTRTEAGANEPPEVIAIEQTKPVSSEHHFWDRENIYLFSGIAIMRGMDYASTRNFQARGRQEILLPDDVVNNSAGFAGLEVAATVTSVGVAYLLHRKGHHKLERWLSIGHISVAGFGDTRNYLLQTRHSVSVK